MGRTTNGGYEIVHQSPRLEVDVYVLVHPSWEAANGKTITPKHGDKLVVSTLLVKR